ncbi:ATP phosphoribosyltransferase [Exilibacterium tricleocarpae]|uniref:ATP phosphoribosyltransferase n=1 Tax=Exilibacterium tricleocarpae TaxID=2591008 RepID=A0A545TSI5_9GAMM|nr:ATP phosphoribosyltransferase [Exilibacterium tricleocarpae]TQV80183.1 ATP phosphoribosyltransferase [Exilibacterium tricleocarpae]
MSQTNAQNSTQSQLRPQTETGKRPQTLTIALTKGRILKETLPLLAAADVRPLEDITRSRKLQFETNRDNVRLLVLRGIDVPTYVQYGAADLGIAGKDTLMEYGGDGLYEPIDLKIAKCRLMTAAIKGAPAKTGRIKVATKYVNVAKHYYASRGRQVDVIKLYGAMELAPIMALADEIVDIVDTGNTLRANGLEPREHIADISSRVIVNKASMKMKYRPIGTLLDAVAASV